MGLVAHPWIVTPEPRSIPRCVGLTEDLETHVGRYFPACNRIATVVLQTRGGQTSFPKQEDSHMHIGFAKLHRDWSMAPVQLGPFNELDLGFAIAGTKVKVATY